jgi:hypothetical protein
MGAAVPRSGQHRHPHRPRGRRALRLLAAIGAAVGGLCLVLATLEFSDETARDLYVVSDCAWSARLIPPDETASPAPRATGRHGRRHRRHGDRHAQKKHRGHSKHKKQRHKRPKNTKHKHKKHKHKKHKH